MAQQTHEESSIQLFEFRLIVGSVRIIIGCPRHHFVRVDAVTGDPDKEHAWQIGGDMLDTMDLEDDALPCWSVVPHAYDPIITEYTLYHYNDILAGWCALIMIPIGGVIPGS